MSVEKVYIAANLDDALYDIKSEFKNQSIKYIYSPKESEFIESHIPTLVSSEDLIVLINLDKIKLDVIEHTLCLSRSKRTVWVFKKLAKNTKIYKTISKNNIYIKTCSSLKKTKAKKQFIEEVCNNLSIPKKYTSIILDRSGEDKGTIYQEIKKFAAAIKCTNNPLDSLISDSSDLDALMFVDNLLNRRLYESLKYYSKLQGKSQYHQIGYLLGKQILCYIHLCQDNIIAAKATWNIPDWLINEKHKQAKKLGMKVLCGLYDRLMSELHDYELGRDPETSMRKLILDLCS